MMMGQAAGAAAVLAVQDRVKPADIDYKKLQEILRKQDISLP
jgi:hypothetical protein